MVIAKATLPLFADGVEAATASLADYFTGAGPLGAPAPFLDDVDLPLTAEEAFYELGDISQLMPPSPSASVTSSAGSSVPTVLGRALKKKKKRPTVAQQKARSEAVLDELNARHARLTAALARARPQVAIMKDAVVRILRRERGELVELPKNV